MKTFITITLVVGAMLTTLTATAGELVTQAQVISSEPVFEKVYETHVPERCFSKPGPQDFGAMLAWDMDCTEQRVESVFVGYDVSYELDGRTFRSRMHENPGDTIPLLLTLD